MKINKLIITRTILTSAISLITFLRFWNETRVAENRRNSDLGNFISSKYNKHIINRCPIIKLYYHIVQISMCTSAPAEARANAVGTRCLSTEEITPSVIAPPDKRHFKPNNVIKRGRNVPGLFADRHHVTSVHRHCSPVLPT